MPASTGLSTADIVGFTQVLIALVAAAFALLAVDKGYKSQRLQSADDSWHKYLELCIQYPSLAAPDDLLDGKIDYSNKTLNGSKTEFQQYSWFVSYLLTTVSMIKRVKPKDAFWHKMLVLQISYHKGYLSKAVLNPYFKSNSESVIFQIVEEGIRTSEPYFYPDAAPAGPAGPGAPNA